MVRLLRSKNGLPVAIVNGIYLNSRYDPLQEARQTVFRQLGSSCPKTVIVLGETLGYISQAISAHSPGCRCLQIFYDASLYRKCRHRTADAWHPQMERSCFSFIRSSLNELEVQKLSVILWAPSAKAYPEIAAEVHVALRRVMAIYNGNIATTAGFGKLWLRNTVRNYLAVNSIAEALPRSELIVIAASGPSLADSIQALLVNRRYFYLIALPSALSALIEAGLSPDLVVITDPGFYSSLHLSPFTARRFNIAMPYTAVKEACRYASQVVLLNQGTYLENTLIVRSRIPCLRIEQNGTVAGTAFGLGRMIGTTIVFAGLDLAGRDIQSHVRPHVFDPLIELPADRLSPAQTIRYSRFLGHRLRSGNASPAGAFETYAGWFDSVVPALSGSVYRLNESPVRINGIVPLDGEGFTALCGKLGRELTTGTADRSPVAAPSLHDKKNILRSVLSETRDAVRRAALQRAAAFIEATPSSVVYFASTSTLLKALSTSDTGTLAEAVDQTIAVIDDLLDYVDTWAQ